MSPEGSNVRRNQEVSTDESASQIVFNIFIVVVLEGACAVSDWRKSAGILAARLAAFGVPSFRGQQNALREATRGQGQSPNDPTGPPVR
jgi:hypothetical protein